MQVDNNLPVDYVDELIKISVVKGACLFNSQKVSKLFNEIQIAEGFLVSQFDSGEIECVGHVWNCINNKHFDLTINRTDDLDKIRCNSYFIATIYNENDKKTELRRKSNNIYDFDTDTEIHLVYKTEVKKIEIDLRTYLKSINFLSL